MIGLTRRELLYALPASAAVDSFAAEPAFHDRLQPAPADGGFRMDGYWVWCGSVIRGEDGRYHMFASRWPGALPFSPHWLTNSEIVRASSATPGGPYRFEEVVLPARGGKFWDGRMTHNPTIHRSGDTYLLFYTGTTYSGPTPVAGQNATTEARLEARANQRIGVATARSLKGPWRRPDRPAIDPRPGKWDALMTTNPAPCVEPGGSVLLIYKSSAGQQDLLRMGAARAASWRAPYVRLKEEEIFHFGGEKDHVEDAYVWRQGGRYELIMKDMAGGICGENGGGIHAVSPDGVNWRLAGRPLAWSRTLRYDDGSKRTFLNVERPQLLIEDGRPAWLFVAVADGPSHARRTRTWNQAIPLQGV